MSADLLRQAAALMRERAEASLPVDATQQDGTVTFTWAEQMDHIFNAGCAPHFKHFGHPTVAFAVADWLDDAARRAAQTVPDVDDRALAVARAYLGDDTDERRRR